MIRTAGACAHAQAPAIVPAAAVTIPGMARAPIVSGLRWLTVALPLLAGCGDDAATGASAASSSTSATEPGATGASSTGGSTEPSDATASAPTSTLTPTSGEGDATSSGGDATSSGGDATSSGGEDTSGGETTGGAAPPFPTGWVMRWPPPGPLLCDPDYPIGITVHQGRVFVGTNCGEVFRSADAGVTWEARPTPVVPKMPLPMGTSGPQVWDFATYGDALFAGIRGAGVYRTIDGGDTWESFNVGISGFGPKQVLSLHRVGDTLYAATFGGGVLASKLDAADFKPVNDETADPAKRSPTSTCPNTPGYLDPISMQPMTFLHGFTLDDDGTYLYYSNKCGGVYRTPLAGLPAASAWEGHGDGLPFFFAYFQDPFSLAHDGDYLYAGIDDEGAYRTPVGQPAAWEWITQSGLIGDKLDILSWTIAGDTVYIGARFGGAYASTTQGSPWTDLNKLPGGKLGPGGAETVYGLAHDEQHVYAATEIGVFVSL